MTITTIDSTVEKIVQWGNDRGIIQNGKSISQAIKTLEEVTELFDGINKGSKEEIKDAIGDVVVTLIMCAEIEEMTIKECIESAYNEIKDRKGYLTPEGIFVKEV